jgi:hypothetical protein
MSKRNRQHAPPDSMEGRIFARFDAIDGRLRRVEIGGAMISVLIAKSSGISLPEIAAIVTPVAGAKLIGLIH